MGCNTDKDCMYHNEDGSELYNFQSCRAYPSKRLPTSNSANGCICLNYIVGMEIDESTGRVYCKKNDSGSLAIYVLDGFIILFQFFVIYRCLYILLIFGKLKVKQVWKMGMKRDRPVSLVKRHGLVCLSFLLMNCLCFSIYRLLTVVSYILGLITHEDIFGKQLRPDQGQLRIILFLSYLFLGLCCLHFTILWLSTTRALFSKEAAQNADGCFNAIVYKRFINTVQCIYFVLIIALASTKVGVSMVNFVVLATAIVIIYEFIWGCKNITRMLKVIASWSKVEHISSSSTGGVGISDSATAAKLLSVAEKIDKFSSRIRISGFFTLLFYAIYILIDLYGM